MKNSEKENLKSEKIQKKSKNSPAALSRRVSSEVIGLDTRVQYSGQYSTPEHRAEPTAHIGWMLTSAGPAVSLIIKLVILMSLSCCQSLYIAVRFVESNTQNTILYCLHRSKVLRSIISRKIECKKQKSLQRYHKYH